MTSQNRRPTMKDNQAKYPQLRFKGFTDPWEERKLGQYTKLITKGTTPKDKTGIGDVNFVKVENITNGKIYPINKIKQNEHDNYLKRSRLEEKDILFSIAGTLGRTAIVNKSILPANTNQALAIIRGYDFDTNFLITSLAGNVVKEYIRRNPTVGAQPNLSLEQVGNLLVNTPNAEEQQKIGSFFKQLDDTIALHQRKLAKLKELKQGYLQKLFPKNGSKFPQLRFAGFADAWEQRKVGELYKVTRGQVLATSKTTPEKVGKNQYPVYSSQTKNDGLMGYYSDYLFDTAITWTTDGANAGTVNFRPGKFYSTNVNGVLLSADGLANKAMAENLNRSAWKWVSHVGNPKLMNNVMSEISVMIPVNLSEQEKISEFLMMIDNTIALHQRKLEKLQELKKGYLQKMFC